MSILAQFLTLIEVTSVVYYQVIFWPFDFG